MPDHVAPEQPAAAAEAVATAAKDAYPRIVATLIRVTGDWTLAEDCAQDALALALQRWPDDGVPANPGGWLMTVARNRAIDLLRRASVNAGAMVSPPSRTRRSAWPGCSTSSCRQSPRSPHYSPCSCFSTPAGTPGMTRTAICSPSTSRTADVETATGQRPCSGGPRRAPTSRGSVAHC